MWRRSPVCLVTTPARPAPTTKAPSDTSGATTGRFPLPAMPAASNTIFPVWFAVNTWPNPRKLEASTMPVVNARAKSALTRGWRRLTAAGSDRGSSGLHRRQLWSHSLIYLQRLDFRIRHATRKFPTRPGPLPRGSGTHARAAPIEENRLSACLFARLPLSDCGRTKQRSAGRRCLDLATFPCSSDPSSNPAAEDFRLEHGAAAQRILAGRTANQRPAASRIVAVSAYTRARRTAPSSKSNIQTLSASTSIPACVLPLHVDRQDELVPGVDEVDGR
jgi:hypothetical protein